MAHEEQLAWEARAGKPAAISAFAAAIVAVAAGVYLQVALGGIPAADEYLLEADREPIHFIVSGVLLAIGSLLVIPVLRYLYRATRHRRPELPPTALYLGILGAVTLAVTSVWRYVEVTTLAEDFFPFDAAAHDAADREEAAEDAIREALPPALQGVGVGGSLSLAFALVMISLNAMRTGLLSRFMGVFGIFVGVLIVIPLPIQIIQLFWFAALGVLFLGRWPGGRGPAWETGEPIPWPSATDQRALPPDDGGPPPAAEPEPHTPRPRSRKRKKKRR